MNLPVKKIELILPQKKIEKIVDRLQSAGILEIIPNTKSREITPSKKSDYKHRKSEVDFVLSFLEEFKPTENFIKNLLYSFVPIKNNFKQTELEEIATSSYVDKIIKKCSKSEEKLNKLNTRKNNLLEEITAIQRFEKTSILKDNALNKVSFFAGSIKIKEKEEFLNNLPKKNNYFIEEGETDLVNFYFAIFYPKKEAQTFINYLKKYSAREEEVFWEKNPETAIEERKKELSEIDPEIDIQKKEVQKILFFVPKMEALSDWLSWQIEKEEFFEEGESTKNYFSIKAWIAENKIEKAKKEIEAISPFYLLNELPLEEDDNPPVILENRGIGKSFGIVTGVYGLPKEDELDPTIYLAPFFIFFFALALSDSGYGVLLIALSFLAKRMFKGGDVDNFFNLFIFGGLLTTIAGIFAGTVFGTDIAKSLRVADPINDPIGTLQFVLMLGFFQIFVGLLIGLIWKIKNKNIREGISSNGSSIVFFIGVVMTLITGSYAFAISGLIFMLLLAIFASVEANILLKVGKGFGAIYGLVGYFSDILSYSRILALGLATGIIAAVINMIAVLVMEMIPVPGLNWLIAGIVLIVGHVGNLLINALGAFIHSARLQFVEFFSKFMEGGGKYFKPFTKKGRFIKVINN